ncbi:MAG: O-antigen ligase family protein [Chloroflexota bacterium]
MAHIRSLLNAIIAHPVARVALAFLLLAGSVGGLSLAAYADEYANGGVTWDRDTEQIPLAQVNPMGINLFLEKEVDRDKVVKSLEMTRDGGYKWIRQGFSWNDIEISGKGIFTDTRNPGVEVSAWDKYDFIVDQANKYGLQILARIDSPPVWARLPYDDIQQYHKGPPRDNNEYGDFAAAVAERYKGKIKYFQIWNEPNLIGEWGGHPVNAEEYTALLKVAHDRIKAVNPEAVIVTAALAPTTENSVQNQNDILYLEAMYRAGAAPYFDVLSTMLYSLGQPPNDRRADLKRLNFSRPILLREVMLRNHDEKKPIWISEYAWISLPPDFAGDPARNIWGQSVDEETQGRYLVEGYERARAEWPWMGVMFVWHLRNPDGDPLEPATWFSILHEDFTPRPAYNALKEYSTQVPVVPTPEGKPLWNAVGIPALYIIFGLLSMLSAGYAIASMGRWAGAALDWPRGRFTEDAREIARNAAAVAGMVLLFGLYYRVGSLPLIALALGGWWLIALFKPSTGLALVAFAIPFFWLPKIYGSQHFPVAETMMLLVFAAVLARRIVSAFRPRLAEQLGFVEARRWGNGVGFDGAEWRGAASSGDGSVAALLAAQSVRGGLVAHRAPVLQLDPKTTRPLPVSDYASHDDVPSPVVKVKPVPPVRPVVYGEPELRPASWPSRPSIFFTRPDVGEDVAVERAHQADTDDGRWVEEDVTLAGANIPAARKNGTSRAEELLESVSAVLRSSVGPASAVRNPRALWARFLAWNGEDAFAAPGVLLLLLGALSLLVLANPDFAADSARAYRWVIIETVLFYFLMTDVIKGKRGLLRMLDFFMVGAVIVALYGLWQFAGGGGTLDVEGVSRVQSVYEHPNNLALYLGRAAPFAVCFALFLPWGNRKVLYALTSLPLWAAFLLTFSRGAWGAAVVAVVVAVSIGLRWPLGWIRLDVPRTFKLWLAGVGVGIVALGLLVVVVFPKLPDRILDPGSGLTRVTIWTSALHMALDHPVFGVGPDQFLNQYQTKYGPCQEIDGQITSSDPNAPNECFTAHPHNLFLDYWLSLGIMGLFVLAWLLWRYYRESIDLAKWAASKVGADPLARALAIGLIAGMTDFLVHGLVDNSYFLMDLALIFWMSCGMVQLLRKRFDIRG